jgi:prevent-host-death family protein
MSSEELTIEQARAKLGDLVIKAMNGHSTVLTRYGKPVARITPYVEEPQVITLYETKTYTAAIGLVSSVVAGDHCDLSVIENTMVGAREDEDGNEVPVYSPEGPVVMEAVELPVRTDEDVAAKVYDAADDVLEANGWRRTGDWEDDAGDAAYATVERA